jgi:diguanylate cyclase (GGDEF)-like protein
MDSGVTIASDHSGLLSPAIAEAPRIREVPASLRLASRLIPIFSALLLAATVIGGLMFYIHARGSDDAVQTERRQALRVGAEQFRPLIENGGEVSVGGVHALERISGIEGLRWEAEPERSNGREVQSVVDGQGRILGWLTWEASHPMTDAVMRLAPFLIVIVGGLIGLGALSIWQSRRLDRELVIGGQLAHRLIRLDPLTDLANMAGVLDALEEALATRAADHVVTLVFLDLEGFRELNDSLGRAFGNELLRAAAHRFSQVLPPGMTAGRIGRHKFFFVLPVDHRDTGLNYAKELVELACQPFWILGQGAQMGATVGLAHAPRDGLSADELMRHTTLALRSAKRKKRGGIVSFEPPMAADLQERRFIERELRRALQEKALDLHYQPIVSAEGSRIVGVEALLRWNHPTRGYIPPMDFVPIAERTGMMPQLGEFVLRRAMKDAQRWPELFVAINLSPVQMKRRSLVPLIASLLAESNIEPSRIVLEITEGVLMDDPEAMKRRLEELRALGVRIALDDFGSGYSSLSYLQRFPFDKLKIDRAFVTPLGRFENSAVIIQAMVALGRALGLSVLVEGVETEEQRVLLRLAGCDEMQGYLFAKAAPGDAIDRLLLEAKLRGTGVESREMTRMVN